MNPPPRQLRSVLSVALPVAIAAVLVCLAMLNMVSVRSWHGEPEDGVFWDTEGLNGTNVIAKDIAKASAAERAGLLRGDMLLLLDGREVKSVQDVEAVLHSAADGRTLVYVVTRQSAEQPVSITLQPMPLTQFGLYYSLAAVGI